MNAWEMKSVRDGLMQLVVSYEVARTCPGSYIVQVIFELFAASYHLSRAINAVVVIPPTDVEDSRSTNLSLDCPGFQLQHKSSTRWLKKFFLERKKERCLLSRP